MSFNGNYYLNSMPSRNYFTGTFQFTTIIGILTIAALWMIFTKAKEEGWAAVIPFYNVYVLYKITWGNGWYFLLLLIPLANIVIHIITMVKLSRAFGKGGAWACGLIFLYPIFICIMAFDKSIVYVGEFAGTADTASTLEGSNWTSGQQSADDSSSFCPSCGSAINEGNRFCIHCGHQL